MIRRHARGVRHTAHAAHGEPRCPERHNVVGEPPGLEGRVQAAHEPGMLGRDAGRAMVRVAALGLNAADGEPRFPAHVDHVTPRPNAKTAASGNLSRPEPTLSNLDQHRPASAIRYTRLGHLIALYGHGRLGRRAAST